MTEPKLILDYVYDHEANLADQVFLTQPIGKGQVKDYTWAQTLDQSRRMAAHLRSLGFEPGSRIALLSKNCAHFFMTELAIWMAGYTTVAIFPTETAETVRYVLEHSEAKLLFVGKLDTWPQQISGVPQGVACIALPLSPQTNFETWDAIVARTQPLGGRPQRNTHDMAMLIYTSGSTGQPKGAMISFGAITRAGEGFSSYTRERLGRETEIRILSYLPLAHSYERSCVEASCLVAGEAHVYFAETLDTFLQDLQRARPTIFISVPRLWLKFQQGVFAKMPPKKLDRLLSIPILGRIVGKKVLKGLGLDQVRNAASGSAPIPADLIAWYRRLGLKLYEGYGMTEDNSFSHGSNENFNEPGYVGVAMPGVQVRISAQGEILIKSPSQFDGYYKQPELTAESFTDDGFFHTGDLGELRADGLLKITGRAKELFKTAKGKYVAPAPIENLLNAHPLIELSLVSGVGQVSAYGMVVLAETIRPQLGNPQVRSDVESQLTQLLKDVNRQLSEYEHLRMLVVVSEPWSIEAGTLTPTMKVRRSRIEAAVAHHVEGWYAGSNVIHWN